MRYGVMLLSAALGASDGGVAFANHCEGGQQPVPPAISERMALPLCGMAATQSWGPNGCQLCDPRNIYPNPFGLRDAASSRPYRSIR